MFTKWPPGSEIQKYIEGRERYCQENPELYSALKELVPGWSAEDHDWGEIKFMLCKHAGLQPSEVKDLTVAMLNKFIVSAARERRDSRPAAAAPKPEGEWSHPMSKTDMRVRLGNLSQKKFETFTKSHPIRGAGNRQLFQIRIDGMDAKARARFK